MSNPREPLRRIVIAGAGQLGVLAAIGLKRAVPAAEVIVLSLPPDPGALADRAVTALPFTNRLHDRLGIAEDAIIARAQGSHRLVTRYFNWGGRGQGGAVPYGVGADPMLRSRFAIEWGGGPRNASSAAPAGSLAEVLADAGRFAVPPAGDDRAGDTPIAQVDYALRWNAEAYRALLVEVAQGLGVGHVAGTIAGIERDEAGGIAALVTGEGGALSADLFVDCSGPSALLLAAMPGFALESWREQLPLRKLILARPQPGMAVLEDRFTLTADGWISELAGRDGLQVLLGLAPQADERAALQSLGAPPLAGFELDPSRAVSPWLGNVVALGDAAARFEPLAHLNLDLAHRQLDLLLEMLPGRMIEPLERAEYNRRSALMMDSVRDTLAAHYAAPLARTVFAPAPPSALLATALDQFARRGRLPFREEAPLLGGEFQALLGALGHPRGEGPQQRAAGADDAAMRALAAQARAALEFAPPYAEWLNRTVN